MQLKNLQNHNIIHGFSETSFGSMVSKKRDNAVVKFLESVSHKVAVRDIVWAQQVFGSKVHTCKITDFGKIIKGVDGLISDIPGQILAVIAADCMPILIFDPVNNVVAALHGSRKSLISGIVPKALAKMVSRFNSKPRDILVGIGPHIRKCHYWLKPKTHRRLQSTSFKKYFVNKKGKTYFDLKKLALRDFLTSGIQKKNIQDCGICTFCDHRRYFSARKEEKRPYIYKTKHPRFAGFIGLKTVLTLKLSNKNIDSVVKIAERAVKEGEIIVAPTDTVYGLLADATNKEAVERVFQIKKRRKNKAISVLVKDLKMAKQLAVIDKKTEGVLKELWPGAMTAVLKRKTQSSKFKTKTQNLKVYGIAKKTIALRIPDHKFVKKLLEKTDKPLTGTSANISGEPSPAHIKEIISQLKDKEYFPDLIIDVGRPKKNLPSTVVDLTKAKPKILRKGSKIPKL